MDFQKSDLSKFFNPGSIAIVGVSTGNFKLGGTSFLHKLKQCGFSGRLYPLNPKAESILGLKAWPDLSSLPEVPDLAIVCIAARRVPAVLEECARVGVRHIHIMSSGFKELGTQEGKEFEEQVASIARERGLFIIGPNCMGPYCPSSRLTPWGAIPGLSGPLGIISQSGTITQRLTEHACSLGIGVEKAVSIGNAAVLSNPDYLEFMAEDERIRVIAMYIESVGDGKNFLTLARDVNRKKPVIIWKGGESDVGALTVSSHTGAMAGEQKIWKAFFRQTGAVQVRSMEEWVDTMVAFCLLPAPEGKGVFFIGGGGGSGVVHSDTFIKDGLFVPPLSEDTMERLRQIVPAEGSIAGNPLDEFRVFQDSAYLAQILELAYKDPSIAMIVVDRLIPRNAYHLPDMPDSNPATIAFMKSKRHQKPTVVIVDSDGGDVDLAARGAAMRAQYCKAGIPAYPSVKRAARALVHLYNYNARYSSPQRRKGRKGV